MRIPGLRDHNIFAKSLHYSSKISKWLEEDHLVKGSTRTNWKRQYKLRHNWSRGSCNVSETQVAERPSIPPLLVRLHEDVVITVDATEGLRAWRMSGEQRLLASLHLEDGSKDIKPFSAPTSLAVDTSTTENTLGIAVGFADGRFGTYELDRRKCILHARYSHPQSSNGSITAIAYAAPYLLSMTDARLLSFYLFEKPGDIYTEGAILEPPCLLSSLKSYTAWPPLSLAIRVSPTSIFAAIAYAMPTYLAGWSVGLQELLLAPTGKLLESRLAAAQTQGFTPLSVLPSRSNSPSTRSHSSPSREQAPVIAHPSKPTSLSYTHPYLLAAHADNTLTLYMVTSNAEDLSIGPGHRLWGHTSSVSSAHVGDRGKAVSVSKHGNELRVWELEGGRSSHANKRRTMAGEASIQVRPEKGPTLSKVKGKLQRHDEQDPTKQGISFGYDDEDLAATKGWVAFNEETVVVLREQQEGSQALVVYDFT